MKKSSIFLLILFTSVIFFVFLNNILPFGTEKIPLNLNEGLTIHPDNRLYFSYNGGNPHILLTAAYTGHGENPKIWTDPVNGHLRRLKDAGFNSLFFIIELRKGQGDSLILSSFKKPSGQYKTADELDWNIGLLTGLKEIVECARDLDIIVSLAVTSECVLEERIGGWQDHIFNEANGGPVPSASAPLPKDGRNFFVVEPFYYENEPPLDSNNWLAWNTYYQGAIFYKLLYYLGENPNLIIEGCFEIDDLDPTNEELKRLQLDWVKKTKEFLRIIEEEYHLPRHLLTLTLTKTGLSRELIRSPDVDAIALQNRWRRESSNWQNAIECEIIEFFKIMNEVPAQLKPIIWRGLTADEGVADYVDEPEFMWCASFWGTHPSTKIIDGDLPPKQYPQDWWYPKELNEYFNENVLTWKGEPGDEISEENLPSPFTHPKQQKENPF